MMVRTPHTQTKKQFISERKKKKQQQQQQAFRRQGWRIDVTIG
jgi:hypothetical protein